jgi:hypothetical protein
VIFISGDLPSSPFPHKKTKDALYVYCKPPSRVTLRIIPDCTDENIEHLHASSLTTAVGIVLVLKAAVSGPRGLVRNSANRNVKKGANSECIAHFGDM